MSKHELQGVWHQVQGDVKRHWGKLTDDDIHRIGGNVEKLSGKLQEYYGFTKEQAQTEITKFLKEFKRH